VPAVLDKATQLDIARITQDRWTERCEAGEMAAYMQRKERGHGLADFVEDVTVTMLTRLYAGRVAFQGSGAKRRRRSMGDIWIESGGVFNPINIKTGVKEPNRRSAGQPNLVSLAKLTQAVFERWIDSYYLLFIRFLASDPPTVTVRLVDLLHIVEEFAHFDAGTGQLMLRASRFDDPPPTRFAVAEPQAALAHLLAVREDGNQRLQANRDRDLAKVKAEMAGFDGSTPIDQGGLELDPPR
jgi:hypothetical protein